MENKVPNILYFTHKPVFPIIDGGCKAMAQFLELLGVNKYRIEHFTLATEKHPFNKNAYPSQLTTDFSSISTRLRPTGVLSSFLKGNSYHLSRFHQRSVELHLADFVDGKNFDYIIFESLYTLPYVQFLRTKTKAKMILRAHNVEHLIWEKVIQNNPATLKSRLLKKMTKALKKEELNLLSKVDGVLAITKVDELEFKKLGCKVPLVCIPINIPSAQNRLDFSSNTFFHLGSMNWEPNIEAVQQLCENIFPKILREEENAQLVLAGSYMEQAKYAEYKNVDAIGFVEQLDSLYTKVGILLAPIISGSGVRVKILEALSKGIPVITTPQGAEGLEPNEAVIVAKNDEEFISKALDLYRNEALRERLGLVGQEFIHQKYSRESVSLKLDAFLRSI